MTYLNGKDILPEELFIQVQEYCAGELIYIPKKMVQDKAGETARE